MDQMKDAELLHACIVNWGQPATRGKYRGRFAPSPTGALHLGSMFTALASFLQAKSHQGQWMLRLDDVDTLRVAAGASDGIRRTLERHALHWDEAVVRQSRKTESYEAALGQLETAGWLYPCSCSRKELATLARLTPERMVYPGTCRNARISRRRPHAMRVLAGNAIIHAEDKLQGPQFWDMGFEVGDFVVLRRDGIISYHLATVIDDWEAGVTEVLRGRDLLESTPRQIHLQSLLGLPRLDYIHVPIIVNRHGIKLSKQNLARAVDELNPSATLFELLLSLNQSPTEDIRGAPPEEILAWASQTWDISKLSGLTAITMDSPAAFEGKIS
jgi:glutamyl-Q tRNA(Asp) synthetase